MDNNNKITEDLAVWFGKKKKPKGSKQPKGPWVDICRKNKDGKHPPCGRSDADKGSYPKCRAAGVAGKMSDSEKRSACQQKRKVEKKDPQTGKGQKPNFVSHKKKKKNESVRRLITAILREEVTKEKVKCDKCGWSWKLSEGGHDKYICHKCNHNNEPNKLKEQTLIPDAIKTFLIKRPLLDKVFKNFFGITISMNERRLFVDEVLGGVKKVFEDVSKVIDSPHEIEDCGAYDFKFKFKPYNYSDELLRVDGSASVDVDATLTLHLGENLTPTTKSLREWFKDEDSGWEIRIEVIDCVNDFFYENVFKKTGVVVDVDDIDFDFEK